MTKKTITNLLSKMEKEVNKAYDGVVSYAETLEDTDAITDHLDKIDKFIEQLKEMI